MAKNNVMKAVSMGEVKEFYARNNPDGHWFDKDSMRFFKTKLPRNAYQGNGGVTFITQETNPSDETRYTIRRQKHNGAIETVGEFHSYRTREAAMEAMRLLHA